MKTYKVELPKDSLIYTALDRIDYWDAYGIKVPLESANVPAKMPVLFFKVFPAWFRGLMYLREAIAKVIGLKTAMGMDVAQQIKNFKGEVGESIAVFNVIGRSETELLTNENDAHLNFCLSFFAFPQGDETELILATTVQFNGWLGKVYFVPVGPIHRLITPIILKRIAAALLEEQSKNLSMT